MIYRRAFNIPRIWLAQITAQASPVSNVPSILSGTAAAQRASAITACRSDGRSGSPVCNAASIASPDGDDLGADEPPSPPAAGIDHLMFDRSNTVVPRINDPVLGAPSGHPLRDVVTSRRAPRARLTSFADVRKLASRRSSH